MFVLPISEAHADVDAFSTWAGGRPSILLAPNKGVSRALFDAAHELGHLVLHDDTHSPGAKEVEDEANRFAGAFLAPRETFSRECPQRWSLPAFLRLKERWWMSMAALAQRGLNLDLSSESSYRSAYQGLNMLGFRKKELLSGASHNSSALCCCPNRLSLRLTPSI